MKTLPPVPKWWWEYGMKQELDRRRNDGMEFDKKMSNAVKTPNDQAQRPLADSDAGRKGNRE